MSRVFNVCKVLIIGLWGFPGNWQYAQYEPVILSDPNCPEKYYSWDYSGNLYYSHSSTLALAKALLDKGLYDVRIAIYGSDTLASPPRPSRSDGDETRQRLNKELENYLREFESSDPGEYRDVVERAKRVLELYVYGYADELDSSLRNAVKIVDVVPGIGTFNLGSSGRQYRYIGSPINTLSMLILKILDVLKEERPDLIILDISHGVNYLPVLGREATIIAAKAYASLVEDKEKTVLAIVNSDPVQVQGQLARIHLIELYCYKNVPLKTMSELSKFIPDRPRLIVPLQEKNCQRNNQREEKKDRQKVCECRKTASSILSEYRTIISTFKNIFNYGLVLYLVHVVMNENEVVKKQKVIDDLKKLREIINKVMTEREIRPDKTMIEIKDRCIVCQDLVSLVLILDLLVAVIDKVNNLVRSTVNGMLSLKTLEELSNKLGISEVGKLLLERDCDEIRDAVYFVTTHLERHGINMTNVEISLDKLLDLKTKLRSSQTVNQKELQEYLSENLNKCPMSIDEARNKYSKRNFYAHSGLERKITKVLIRSKDKENIYIGYIDACKDIIEELAKL